MKRRDATQRIKRIIDDMIGGSMEDHLVEHVAERIYVDVMAPAVDDEREKWVKFAFTHHDYRTLH